MTEEGFIKYYNGLVSAMVEGKFRPAYGRRGGFVRFNPRRLTQAKNYLTWLVDKNFYPQIYLSGCFGEHNWCYQPNFDRLDQRRYIGSYLSGAAQHWYELTSRLGIDEKNNLLHPAQELVKKRLRLENKISLCMVHSDSGGFNPISEICQICVLREACKHGHDRGAVQI